MDTNYDSDQFSESSIRNSIRIYFILLGNSKPEDECNALLLKAFQKLTEDEMSADWKDEKYCLALKGRPRNRVFVLPIFDGKAFDHLRDLRSSIVGPGLMLSCIQDGKALPKTHYPILSDCMEGVVACCSNIKQAEREEIRKQVISMSGRIEGSLSVECTVLITTEVGSNKYKAAVKQKNILIVTPGWIDLAWRRAHTEVFKVKNDDDSFSKYKCPVFAGLTITVSNLKDLRQKAEKLVVENGGKFSGEMKTGETTHLVTDTTESNSQKYKTAKRWTNWPIKTVGTAWLFDSVNSGYCLNEDDYLTEKLGGSSPKRSVNAGRGRRPQKCSTPGSGTSTNGAPPFSFIDPNATGMTTIVREQPNATVVSNASMAATSCVDKTVSCVDNSVFPAVFLPPTVSKGKKRPSTQSRFSADVLKEYISDDAQDPNVSIRPQFDLADAYDYLDSAKKKAPSEESPSIFERNLRAAAEAMGAGVSVYNSPAANADDVRRTLAKRLENMVGRTSVKRNGSSNAFTTTTATDIASPILARTILNGTNTDMSAAQSPLPLQDTQENVVVDWDDPNQKRERQKVGGLLKKRNEPTQSLLGDDDEAECQVIDPSPPPPAPAAPVAKQKVYVFQLTAVDQAERIRGVEIIKKLGGSVSEVSNFDLNCTHLIAANPTRNEKLLAAIASGIWVLHVSYLESCEGAKRFVEEADYEFGSPSTFGVIAELREEVAKLMHLCPRWRRKVQAEGGAKAYSGWNVFLVADKQKEDGLCRILKNGDAVVTKSLHEAKEGVITHVIMDANKKPTPIMAAAVTRLQAAGAKCYKTDVIFAYLAEENLNDHLFKF